MNGIPYMDEIPRRITVAMPITGRNEITHTHTIQTSNSITRQTHIVQGSHNFALGQDVCVCMCLAVAVPPLANAVLYISSWRCFMV